ncbi:hypothetical protein OG21DRAFT_1527256 [Imleria badia]|nr:hypothetical protein OG21DRAFT_1527256 [Imleria badia]
MGPSLAGRIAKAPSLRVHSSSSPIQDRALLRVGNPHRYLAGGAGRVESLSSSVQPWPAEGWFADAVSEVLDGAVRHEQQAEARQMTDDRNLKRTVHELLNELHNDSELIEREDTRPWPNETVGILGRETKWASGEHWEASWTCKSNANMTTGRAVECTTQLGAEQAANRGNGPHEPTRIQHIIKVNSNLKHNLGKPVQPNRTDGLASNPAISKPYQCCIERRQRPDVQACRVAQHLAHQHLSQGWHGTLDIYPYRECGGEDVHADVNSSPTCMLEEIRTLERRLEEAKLWEARVKEWEEALQSTITAPQTSGLWNVPLESKC